jgi:hypothetical protein
MNDWYDKGEGSEHMKRQIAKSARENPVPHPMCIGCSYKKRRKRRKRVGIIITDLMGGDAYFKMVSEKDYNIVTAYNPTKKWMEGTEHEREVLDPDKFEKMLEEHFFDAEEGEPNERVLKEWTTQTYCPEKIDLSEYNVVGILTLPGG